MRYEDGAGGMEGGGGRGELTLVCAGGGAETKTGKNYWGECFANRVLQVSYSKEEPGNRSVENCYLYARNNVYS